MIRKVRTVAVAGAAFAAGLAMGPLVSAWAQDANGSRAQTYRLLNLFGDVFERVRAEYVDVPNDRDLIENAINGMLTGLDPHSSYMNARAYRDMQVQTRGEFGGLGIEVTQDNGYIKVISPIDDTPASRAGIKSGDYIVMLNGKSVQGLTLQDAVDQMRGQRGSSIKITVRREGVDKPIEMTLVRDVIRPQVVRSRMEDGNIAYIRLASFNEQTDSAMRKALSQLRSQAPGGKLRGIILDLRNNPGGLLDQAVQVSDDFINQGEIVSTRARHPEDSQRWNAHAGDIAQGLPMVVLINSGSASASEIVAGALQDHRRAVLVGTKSFGKGSVQTIIPLPGNGAIRLTTARYYTPSGRSIQGTGITPDIEVLAAREDAGSAPVEREADLNKALRNEGGVTDGSSVPPLQLPPGLADKIQHVPPENQPKYDPTKPDTDFQLQQGLVVLKALATADGITTPAANTPPGQRRASR